MKPFLRQLTDVEIEARIATRLAAVMTRLERLEHLVDALVIVVEILNEQALERADPSGKEHPRLLPTAGAPSTGVLGDSKRIPKV